MFIVDAHLDLSMNAMEWNRDLRLPLDDLRLREMGMTDKPDRGNGVVSFPALRAGNIGLVVATQIARYVEPGSQLPGWNSPEQAWAQTQGQLAWYKTMEESGHLRAITNRQLLKEHVDLWMQQTGNHQLPIGYILSLEGSDSLLDISYVERAFQQGLRAIGPAHYGPGRYAHGTDASARLNENGRALLKEMDRLGIILDVTHLCDLAFWDALDLFEGPVWASHNNCRSLVPHNRQFSDDQIRRLISRGAVIGGALDAWMMVPGWVRQQSTPTQMNCSLETLVDHLDHICSLAGNTKHIGIGTDLDGAFGKEQCPMDLDSIADLQRFPEILARRGFSDTDIRGFMHGNWLRFLDQAWARFDPSTGV